MVNDLAVKAVFFDLGNTLIYFNGVWEDVMEHSYQILSEELSQKGILCNSEEFLIEFKKRIVLYFNEREVDYLEHTTDFILESMLREKAIRFSMDDLRDCLDKMYQYTEAFWYLEDETIPVLTQLRNCGYRLGLITNAANVNNSKRLLDHFGLNSFFEIVLISANLGIRKPHADIFRTALKLMNLNPEDAVMVGDTYKADVVGAHKVGMKSIWLTRRIQRPEIALSEVVRPDWTIENLSGLIPLLCFNH